MYAMLDSGAVVEEVLIPHCCRLPLLFTQLTQLSLCELMQYRTVTLKPTISQY